VLAAHSDANFGIKAALASLSLCIVALDLKFLYELAATQEELQIRHTTRVAILVCGRQFPGNLAQTQCDNTSALEAT
jgi:hypothetical protein